MGERVALRRSGRSYTGLCPFHNEKTPSFHVDPDRRSYKCFGCGEGGDVFTWLEKTDGLTPVEALTLLAARAGVELSRSVPEERQGEKRLLAVHETALFYFRQALRGTPAGKAAAAYLAGRGILPETIERFGLGYAPDSHDGLIGYLRKKGFSDEEAATAGVVARTDRGTFDRFRDRVMIPIRDAKGRTIAFAGRALRADQPAKYVNSPQTPLFSKSATLFALDAARAAMRRAGEAVIVEGQLDAISCHQAGFDTVVASMGTALTREQYEILDRLGLQKERDARAIVAFDGDAAGTASAEKRGRELLRITQTHTQRLRGGGQLGAQRGLAVHVALLPEGTDPDDLARTAPDRLRAALAAARPVLEFVIDRVASRFDLGGPDGRRRFLGEALPLLADEPDDLTRELYLGTLSSLTGVGQEHLRELARRAPGQPSQRPAGMPPAAIPAQPERAGRVSEQASFLERYVMAQLIKFPAAAAHVDLAPEDLADPELRAIFELLRSGRPVSDLPATLAARAAALDVSTSEPEAETDPGHVIEIAALRLREIGLHRRLDEVRAAYARAAAGDAGGAEEVERIRTELEELMRSRERHTVLRADQREEDE